MIKPTLLLLPGLLSNKTIWQHQYHHLQDIAYLKVIDLKAYSSKKMVAHVLREAPKQFALAGHSMGGWLALELMKSAAERVTKLCLLNTTARIDSRIKLLQRQRMVEAVNQGEFLSIAHKLAKKFVHNAQIEKEALTMFLEVGKEVFINQQTALMNREECLSILPKIICPTLVIHAQKDKIFSREVHNELAQKIPHAKLAIVEDSGHLSPMEMPQAITALMRYWIAYF